VHQRLANPGVMADRTDVMRRKYAVRSKHLQDLVREVLKQTKPLVRQALEHLGD